jgi:hypothetical protein
MPEKSCLRLYSSVSYSNSDSDFHRVMIKKKNSTRICSSKHVLELTYESQKNFNVYTDSHNIRQEAFAAVRN